MKRLNERSSRLQLPLAYALPILALGVLPLGAQTGPAVPSTPAISPTPAPNVPLKDLSPDTLARFSDTLVKEDDIKATLDNLDPQQKAALSRDPDLLKKTISSMIVQEVVLKEAQNKKWDEEPAVVAALKRARENVIVQTYLASVSKPAADFPASADLQKVYDANKANLLVPRQFLMAEIYIACPANADAATTTAAQAKRDAVAKKIQQPNADFAAIARAQSDDKQGGSTGGQIGWLSEAQIQPEIRSQMPKLARDVISPGIRLKDGYHFLKVLEVKDAYTPSLDQVRDQLAAKMRAAQAQSNSQAYVTKLLRQNPVVINPNALADLIKKE